MVEKNIIKKYYSDESLNRQITSCSKYSKFTEYAFKMCKKSLDVNCCFVGQTT